MIDNPALTLSLALAAGMLGQALAHHLKVPGIVFLLALGVVLGPDIAGLIRPETLGEGLFTIVGFAVAVILFEGGMNLRISHLRREKLVIRSMILLGALITAIASIFATRTLLGWGWRQAILFGTLIPVTGPTVITPLLRRIKVKAPLSTILEAEGILLDALAAIVAAVVLEVAIAPAENPLAHGGMDIFVRLGFGAMAGMTGGYLLVSMLKVKNLVPAGLENVFTLSIVLAVFQSSNIVMADSGIVAVTVAGLVVGNARTLVLREMLEFKEQLTVLLIGMLFILLAADVRLADIMSLGWGGLVIVLLIVFIIRPASIFISTARSDLNIKQKAFLSWIGPRGIVAAAVASLFSYELEMHGYPGEELRAMVFLVIAVTVLQSGLTGGMVAGALDLRRKSKNGWVILGAHDLARTLGIVLKNNGEEVVCIDNNPKCVRKGEADGLRVIFGNGMEESVMLRAEIGTRNGIVAMTANQDLNLLFAQKARQLDRTQRLIISVHGESQKTAFGLVGEIGGSVLGGRPIDVESWLIKIRHRQVLIQEWLFEGQDEAREHLDVFSDDTLSNMLIPLATLRQDKIVPMDHLKRLKSGDMITVLVNSRRQEEATAWLEQHTFSLSKTVKEAGNGNGENIVQVDSVKDAGPVD